MDIEQEKREIELSDEFDWMTKHKLLLKEVAKKEYRPEPVMHPTKTGVVEGFRIVNPLTGEVVYYDADPVFGRKILEKFKNTAKADQVMVRDFWRETLEELEGDYGYGPREN